MLVYFILLYLIEDPHEKHLRVVRLSSLKMFIIITIVVVVV